MNLKRVIRKIFFSKIYIILIEKIPLFCHVFMFMAAILFFAILYYILTPSNNGIFYIVQKDNIVSFLNALYFSIVTISSLGYGDLHPIGISKFIAGLEVLFGLAMLGIILAKITSSRISYHVKRLFSSDTQRRFDEISAGFVSLQNDAQGLTHEISQAFQGTPGPAVTPQVVNGSEIFDEFIKDFHKKSISIRNYIQYEFQHGDFLADAPFEAIERTGENIKQCLFCFGQLIISIPINARMMILHRNNRKRIRELLRFHNEVCDLFKNSKNKELSAIFLEVKSACDDIPISIFTVPDATVQPDQILQISDHDQPQG